MNRLKAVMLDLIANEAPVGPERRDHALRGAWANHRECHIGGDFLLSYQIDEPHPLGGGCAQVTLPWRLGGGTPASGPYSC